MNTPSLKSLKLFAMATTLVLALTPVTSRAQSFLAYSNAIVNLSPVAYWPMHETNAAAPGDIETNLGTLGNLANGYYNDWSPGNLSGAAHIYRQFPGPFTNAPGWPASPLDYGIEFSNSGARSASSPYLTIPNVASAMQLKPPFTIEWWANANVHQGGSFSTMLGPGTQGFNNSINNAGFSINWNSLAVGTSGNLFNVYSYNGNGSTMQSGDATGVGVVATNQWYYFAWVYMANNATYGIVNGNANGPSTPSTPLNPALWSQFWVANGRAGNTGPAGFSFDGAISEVAIYTNALSTSDLINHYSAGTNALSTSTSYSNMVMTDASGAPVVYLRMNAPAYTAPAANTWPALNNYGSAAGNGVYTPGTYPGMLTGSISNGYPINVFTNQVALLSSMGTFADAGSAVSSSCNPSGTSQSFSVTAMFRGNPADPRTQSIVGHGTNSWQLGVTTNGTIVFNPGYGGAAQEANGFNPGDMHTVGVYNDGNWHQVVAVDNANALSIYVDGNLDTNGTPTGITGSSTIPGNTSDVLIGADPSYTNANVGIGRQFSGQICEVAFFNTALTGSQVQTLYNTAGEIPFIKTQPAASITANGGTGTYTNLTSAFIGSSLTYQWYFNTVSNYSGAIQLGNSATQYTNVTTAQLTITNLVSADNGYYYVVASDSYGSVTSLISSVFIFGTPGISSYLPMTYSNVFSTTVDTNFMAVYAGESPAFSVVASGEQPFSYQWLTNGVPVGGATTNNFAMTNVRVSFTNECAVSNSLGSVTNFWVVTVLPTNGLASYPLQVLALNPTGYWRLTDTNLDGPDNGNGDNGWVCHDYIAGNDGMYSNVVLGDVQGGTGYNPTTDPSDPSAYFGYDPDGGSDSGDQDANSIEGINFGSASGTSAAFTVEAWVSGYAQTIAGAGLVALGWSGGEQFSLDCGAPTNAFRFLFRDASGTAHTVTSIVPPSSNSNPGPWYHLVGVVDEINSQTMTFYINGQPVGSSPVSSGSGVLASTNLMSIGSKMASQTSNFSLQFEGWMNDVSVFNYALSSNQVINEYAGAGDISPFIVATPTNATASINQTLTIPAYAWGTPPLNYEWYDVNGQPIPGASGTSSSNSVNAMLAYNNVPGTWNNGRVELVVNNSYGTTNLYVALTINTNSPYISVNLPAQVTIAANQPYTFAPTVIGAAPLAYQWYNGASPGVSPVSGQTNATYTITLGSPGIYTYSVRATNIEGATNSLVSTVTVVSAPTNAYAAGILALKPVAYWPMHEMEAPAPGDTETNYGTLGLLGTGYYTDWVWPQQGLIEHDFGGALVNDLDSAIYFNYTGGQNGSGDTNNLLIPITSPKAVLNPPFTVECWFYPTNSSGVGDLWGQASYVALNDGSEGSGNGNVSGIRLYLNTGFTFQVYAYNGVNGDTLEGSLGASPYNSYGQWHYVVLTCDANTNISLYFDSTNEGTSSFLGDYSPDSWSPITVATGKGYTRSLNEGVDEFAVYNYALSGSVITNHYTNALDGPAGAYFNAVTNSAPAIYLRMDSSAYTPPSASTWPVLLNFGSAPTEGIYTPGTIPGIVSGPALAGLSGSTNVAQLSGVSSFADAGYMPAYNPVGSNAFSITAMFRGDPCDGRFQDIVGHSDNSWRIAINDNNGHLQCSMGTNNFNSTGLYNDGNWHQVVDVYQPASNPALTGTNTIYVDGMLDSTVTGVSANGTESGSSSDVMIAAAPDYTNNPTALGRQFAGQVCEVALFTNALSFSQVQGLYNAAEGIGGVSFTNGPTISFSLQSNNQLGLTWPGKYVGYYYLQVQTNSVSTGLSNNWVPYNGSAAATLGLGGVTNSIPAGKVCVFYRLMTNAP